MTPHNLQAIGFIIMMVGLGVALSGAGLLFFGGLFK